MGSGLCSPPSAPARTPYALLPPDTQGGIDATPRLRPLPARPRMSRSSWNFATAVPGGRSDGDENSGLLGGGRDGCFAEVTFDRDGEHATAHRYHGNAHRGAAS